MIKLTALIAVIGAALSVAPSVPEAAGLSEPAVRPSVQALAQAPALMAPPEASVQILGADEAQTETIEWAIARYEEAGLPLPALEIRVHQDPEGCQGERGLYRWSDSMNRIDMCTDNLYVLLHELAHAWEVNYATDTARDAYAHSIGLDVWRSDDVEWGDQASERAANAVAWGLLPRLLSESDAASTADMLARYEMLTGGVSPRLMEG